MQQEPLEGPASSAEPAARPRFAVLAVVATIVLAALTSGIALAGGLRGLGDDAPMAQPAWLTPPAAIMAAPSVPVAPPEPASNNSPEPAPNNSPEPAPNNVVVPAAPDTASQPTFPAPGRSSTAVDDEPQSSGLLGNVAQRPQDPPLDAAGATQLAAPPAVDPEFQPAAVTPTITVSRGRDTTYERCVAPDCAFLRVSMRGFKPQTAYTIKPYSDEWGNFNPGATLTTDANGTLNFERFAFGGVGQDVWVVAHTPDGPVESNHFHWENGNG